MQVGTVATYAGRTELRAITGTDCGRICDQVGTSQRIADKGTNDMR